MTPAELLAQQLKAPKPVEPKLKQGGWQGRFPKRNLQNVRLAVGLKVEHVAEALKCREESLSGIENGDDLRLSIAKKIATFYGKTIEEIWPS